MKAKKQIVDVKFEIPKYFFEFAMLLDMSHAQRLQVINDCVKYIVKKQVPNIESYTKQQIMLWEVIKNTKYQTFRVRNIYE